MTVATEACYAERQWTGAETSFAAGFSADDRDFVKVAWLDVNGLPVPLTRGVHYSVDLATGTNAVTVRPIALPPASADAPIVLTIERDSLAVQGVDFVNLASFDPSVFTRLFDRLTMLAAELKGRINRATLPFFASNDVVSFLPRRVKAGDPVDDSDVATRLWVLTITGIANLQSYVTQCAASAAVALQSAADAVAARVASDAARDKAQSWSEAAENTPVQGSAYSAYHWSRKAAAAAASVMSLFNNPDDGIFGDVESGPIDDGVF
ncbi:hypothetical protein LOC51_19840 [Rubrivivax sp. JA1024]|nr:hypothetical protein [Rubrivivax sp. JA1024]